MFVHRYLSIVPSGDSPAMQRFALLGGKAPEGRLEDENDKQRKLIEARCLGYALKILSFIVSSPKDTYSNLFFLFIMLD